MGSRKRDATNMKVSLWDILPTSSGQMNWTTTLRLEMSFKIWDQVNDSELTSCLPTTRHGWPSLMQAMEEWRRKRRRQAITARLRTQKPRFHFQIRTSIVNRKKEKNPFDTSKRCQVSVKRSKLLNNFLRWTYHSKIIKHTYALDLGKPKLLLNNRRSRDQNQQCLVDQSQTNKNFAGVTPQTSSVKSSDNLYSSTLQRGYSAGRSRRRRTLCIVANETDNFPLTWWARHLDPWKRYWSIWTIVATLLAMST